MTLLNTGTFKIKVKIIQPTVNLAALAPCFAVMVCALFADVPRPAFAQTENAPRLQFQNRLIQGTLGKAYNAALDNLLRVNTVSDTKNKHNLAGLMTAPNNFIKAGSGYDEPWTRDASINSWNAASLLEPAVARNTLWAVCQRQSDGTIVLQRDNQWWDKVIWIPAAWNHYKVTGDQKFLETAYGVAQDELKLMRAEHFSDTYGLFQGPAVFCDGIAGYPEPVADAWDNGGPREAQLVSLAPDWTFDEPDLARSGPVEFDFYRLVG